MSQWRNVRSPWNRRAMNRPIGLVASRIRPKKTTICTIPVAVIIIGAPPRTPAVQRSQAPPSELLGLEHRPPEVDQQEDRHDAGDDVVEHESESPRHGRRLS